MKTEMAARIDSYASTSQDWFIQYDPDWESIQYHQDYAAVRSAGTLEAEAIPAASILGGQPFESWCRASTIALGKVLHHIACATRLKATKPSLNLRNLLTIFARKDDISSVWKETLGTEAWADQIISGLTLDAEVAKSNERDHEQPLPYYVDIGRHFVLLPVFGGLMNSHAGLVWHLRRTYRQEWDRAVGGREATFRKQLSELVATSACSVPDRGFRLRRDDGTELTDVDAVLIDHQTGRLALVQLKWPDIYGKSLAERNSRRLNLLRANDWVCRIHEWVRSRSSTQVAQALGLKANSDELPLIVVLARHVARFSGETGYDRRAHWISWPMLAQAQANDPQENIFSTITKLDRLKEHRQKNSRKRPVTCRLPGLRVDIYGP